MPDQEAPYSWTEGVLFLQLKPLKGALLKQLFITFDHYY